MSVQNFKELSKHKGHKIVCVGYNRVVGHKLKPVSVAIECETCSEVLIDFDNPRPSRSPEVRYG
jgi:hypothetical protein